MFRDREDAGKQLALELRKTIKDRDFVVVALLRGGIILGKKISDYFKIPLVPLAVKKIGAPENPELAIGAVVFDKTSYFDEDLIEHLGVDEDYIKRFLEMKSKEARTLQNKFPTSLTLRGASKFSLKNKKIVIVDDGVATGTTVLAAQKFLRKEKAKEIILATPVIGKDTLRDIKRYFDNIISLEITDNLTSISQFYKEFLQVRDEEVLNYLV